jgi:ribosome-associated heat shock protein Hsp15
MTDSIRLDKWLWAARFFKTRALATEAVNGGKVHLNGNRVKPARGVSIGDTLAVQREQLQWVIEVTGLAERRGSAQVAQSLYKETAESIAERERLRELQRLAAAGMPQSDSRPTKKQRQQIIRFKRKQ